MIHTSSLVLARMLPHLKLLTLAQIVRSASCCQNSGHIPNVTVADSQHILVNWEKAFEGCDSSKVQFAIVRIGSVQVGVIFDDKEAKLNADPCLEHPEISMSLGCEGKEVRSYNSSYKAYNAVAKIEYLYSGLLQKQVLDKACVKKNGEFSIPDIPDPIKQCVLKCETAGTNHSSELRCEIVDPKNESETKIVKSEFNPKECSPQDKSRGTTNNTNEVPSQSLTSITIGISVAGTLFFVTFVILAIWIPFKILKNKKEIKEDLNDVIKEDLNVDYDTAGVDYEYVTMGNGDSTRRREIVMEVVDRNSLYGKTEER